MTSTQRRVCITIGAFALALALFGLNIAFEVAGSIPDIEGCGFLAGSVPALLLLFPALSALLTYHMNRALHRHFGGVRRSLALGFYAAYLGAGVYLGGGLLLSSLRPSGVIHIEGIGVSLLLAILCGVGGCLGALRGEIVTGQFAWRIGKG